MLKNNYLQKKYIFSQAGFTLVEMLVVFVILAILATVVLAGYRSGQKRYALSQAAQQLASDFRKAQNMAMGGVDIEGQYYGYGLWVRQDRTYYRFYSDKNDNNRFNAWGDDYEDINLPEGIIVQSTSVGWTADIFFRPPDPTTYINYPFGITAATITLQIEDDPSSTKTITVTTTGRIQVD